MKWVVWVFDAVLLQEKGGKGGMFTEYIPPTLNWQYNGLLFGSHRTSKASWTQPAHRSVPSIEVLSRESRIGGGPEHAIVMIVFFLHIPYVDITSID